MWQIVLDAGWTSNWKRTNMKKLKTRKQWKQTIVQIADGEQLVEILQQPIREQDAGEVSPLIVLFNKLL